MIYDIWKEYYAKCLKEFEFHLKMKIEDNESPSFDENGRKNEFQFHRKSTTQWALVWKKTEDKWSPVWNKTVC